MALVTVSGASWSAPEASTHAPTDLLREAVAQEDWKSLYEQNLTGTIQANGDWSASKERCSTLQCLCTARRAVRVLEIGSFCGAAALAMAEAIPKHGEVLALELESYFVEFGEKFKIKSPAGQKIKTRVGPAMESLEDIAEEAKAGTVRPFDLVIIDADKACMKAYYDLVSSSGLLSKEAVVCVDVTPFKGQPPARYLKFRAVEKWVSHSGQEEITAFRQFVADSPELVAHEFSGMMVIQRQFRLGAENSLEN